MNLLFAAATAHDEALSFWDELWAITFDPAHIVSELIWQIVFDGLFVALLYGVIFKRWLLPKLRKEIHEEIDEEHGIEHHDDHIHVTAMDHHDDEAAPTDPRRPDAAL